MIISETGLARALKEAYKHGGYKITATEDQLCLYTDKWYVRTTWKKLPRKVLATIVEQIGIPEYGPVMLCRKNMPAQTVMPDVAGAEIGAWEEQVREESGIECAEHVPMVVKTVQIYQTDDLHAYGFDLTALAILEEYTATMERAPILLHGEIGIRGAWEEENEVVTIVACRPTAQYWASESEKAVWKALETVDLHMKGVGDE